VKLALPLALAALSCACAPDFREASRKLGEEAPPNREPVLDRRHTYFANDTARPHRDWYVLIYPNGQLIQHGADKSWYSDGKPEWERAYDHGEPTGHWRSWWANGNPRSEATFGNAELSPMRWWHENGKLSSEGQALDGARDGEWTEWREDGTVSGKGTYRLGKKDGNWTFYEADGAVKESVLYRDDLKVGPGEPPKIDAEKPPPR
jgi:hypothetical protein